MIKMVIGVMKTGLCYNALTGYSMGNWEYTLDGRALDQMLPGAVMPPISCWLSPSTIACRVTDKEKQGLHAYQP
jgi:hypothetical protein